MGEGIAGRWEVAEDGYEEQIIIPKEKRELAAQEGITTENKQKVTVQIMNLRTGESYIGRLAITGNHQTHLPPARHRKLRRGGRVARPALLPSGARRTGHARAGIPTNPPSADQVTPSFPTSPLLSFRLPPLSLEPISVKSIIWGSKWAF